MRPEYALLFDPVPLGPVTAPNRFYATPRCASLAAARPNAQIALREVTAEGGWGTVFPEYCSISAEADTTPEVSERIWDDQDVTRLAAVAEAVHRHGALAGIELWHGGAAVTGLESRVPPPAMSAVASGDFPGQCGYEMTPSDIAALRGRFVDAARRALAAGFDIIMLGAAEADSILGQALMPFTNQRRDCYGGPLQNRARLLAEVTEDVRQAVAGRAAVAIRLCIDTGPLPGGIRADGEGAGLVALLDHLVDYWDVQAGGWNSARWGTDPVPSRFAGEDFQGGQVAAVRHATTRPLVAPGRFTSPDTMARVIRSGRQQMIGAARPAIADPFLPAKIRAGQHDEIRECIGCNTCVAAHALCAPIACTQNPTAGEEWRRGWHPERVPRRAGPDLPVLVIGAGPAGLECGWILARRGYTQVHIADAAQEAGGQLQWMTRLPGLAEWQKITDYRLGQVGRHPGAALHLHTPLDAAAVLGYGAQIIICATGSRWARDGLNWATGRPVEGAGLPHVHTPDQVPGLNVPPGTRAVVYDCDGGPIAVGAAELLARRGATVEIITPFPGLAPQLEHTHEAAGVAAQLEDLHVTWTTGMAVDAIAPGEVAVSRVHSEDLHGHVPASLLVLATQRLPCDQLYQDLQALPPDQLRDAGITAVYRAGDCVAPRRRLADAIFDGHRLARQMGTGNPAVAVPFLREIPATGAAR